jgi:hypothetical protein
MMGILDSTTPPSSFFMKNIPYIQVEALGQTVIYKDGIFLGFLDTNIHQALQMLIILTLPLEIVFVFLILVLLQHIL